MSFVKAMSLNKFGTIEVVRGKSLKTKLFCPHRKYLDPKTGRQECSFCGHECSLFSEPEFMEDEKVRIKVCDNEFICNKSDFEDERG